MDYEKIGKFIKKMREEKKWSQETLAEKLFCERTKINKIENAKRYIKTEDLILLSEVFDLTLEELISGEKKNKNNQEQIEITFKEYLKHQNTKIKKLRVTSIILFIAVLLCFSLITITYFFQNYSSIRVYRFYGNSDNYEINDGLLILSKNKIYFKIDSIIPEVDDIYIYSEHDGKQELIYHGDPKIILNDHYGYDSFILYKDFIKSNQNIYIMINEEKINLTFKEDFRNNQIIYKEVKDIGKYDSDTLVVPKKIKDNFKCEDESCYLDLENESLIYCNEMFSVLTKKNYYLYDISNSLFEYQDLDNSEKNFIITIINNEINCVSGNCKKAKKIYEQFHDSYILKYID